MSNTTTPASETKVITGEVRFSYVHVFKPEAIEGGADEKYSVSLLIKKSDKKTLTAIAKAIKAATEAGKNTVFKGKVPANLKTPLRDGDEDRPDDDNYAGCFFVNANSSGKRPRPGILDRYKQPITDEEQFYSGCYGIASVNFYAYDTAGNRGIACGLNNLMKVRDGDFLGGRASAESDFEEVELEDEDIDPML